MARLLPQYDVNGFDTGLFILDNTDDETVFPTYFENLDVRIRRGGIDIVVAQYQGWDNESYLENGAIDAERVELGELECRNPYQDDIAAERLLGWLMGNKQVEYAD